MTDIVLVPTWRRPEFLALTLHHLRAAEHAAEHLFVVLADRGCDPAVLQVVAQHSAGMRLQVLWRHGEHSYAGNSFNVLEGYRHALALSGVMRARLIYLVEEDAWVARDLFSFSRQVHARFAPFVLSAAGNLGAPGGPVRPAVPGALVTHAYYQSVCVSLPPAHLEPILRHAVPDYYSDPETYVRAHFADSAWGGSRHEQDGLIDRIMAARGVKTLYPCVPRAWHAGFVGYNRPGQPLQGALEQRIAQLRQLDAAAMNARASTYKDLAPIDLAGCGPVAQWSLDAGP